MSLKSELVAVETRDQVILHGAFFEGDYNKPAMIIMHDAAMNFYTGVGGSGLLSKSCKPLITRQRSMKII
jgi:hypothetical protein